MDVEEDRRSQVNLLEKKKNYIISKVVYHHSRLGQERETEEELCSLVILYGTTFPGDERQPTVTLLCFLNTKLFPNFRTPITSL